MTFAVQVRDMLDDLDSDQLDELEANLMAVGYRLRQLGRESQVAEKSRVATLLRIGQLLGPGKRGPRQELWQSDHNNTALSQPQRDRRKKARFLAEHAELTRSELDSDKPVSLSRLVKLCQLKHGKRGYLCLSGRSHE